MTTAADYRLSATVQPERYDITLAPDLGTFTFKGEETIEVRAASPVSSVTLNAAELEVQHAQLTLADGTILRCQSVTADTELETVTFDFGREAPPGTAALNIHFTGTLNDQLRGFYRSRYVGHDGRERYLAATQFEATDARRAFPCWDDPAVKAVFSVTLVAPVDLEAISNTPVESERALGDGTKAVRFKPSPRMSTYLVALIVGDMTCVQAKAANGTLMRVWTTRGKEEQGKFALENAVKLLSYYNSYFGIPYPLEKLDHIAVPDFAAGAMENWGAITYRETALLFDPANSAATARQRILEVVSHEMAHMWFGDLVTMEWWDDLWLNESFASWMGDKAVDSLYPEWAMWTQFVSHDTNRALSLDGLRNSHPIEARVKNPAEIRELFDAISYSKGGSVLRMLEHFLGAAMFRRGLRRYLTVHQYANARTEDLWRALEEVSGKPVTALMDSWVKQTGYPLVQVETKRDGGQVDLRLRQSRFLYDRLLDQSGEDGSRWQIPLSVAVAGRDRPATRLMDGAEDRVRLRTGAKAGVSASAGWIKINPGQTGFFRVHYPPAEWERLREAVANREVSATDRLGLQNDAYALVRSGILPASQFLELAEAYKGEVDVTVWGDLAANLGGLETIIADQPYIDQFDQLARGLFEQAAREVGWDPRPGEGHLDALLRSTVLGQAGAYGDPGVIAEAKARFAHYLNDPSSLHPDLRGVVFGLVAQEGGSDAYESLWALHRQAELSEEKVRFLSALSRFKDKGLLSETLRRTMDPDEVRSQDTVIGLVSVARNRAGRDLAWEFVKDNWAEIDRRYGQGGFAVTAIVSTAGAFTTLERAQEVDEFFKVNPAPSAARTVQQSLERIRLNHAWLRRNGEGLASWFDARA